MERSEISLHEIIVYRALLRNQDRWLTNVELADGLVGVAPRTVRAKTAKFVELGLVDQAEVFPAHRYRWSQHAERRNRAYLLRLRSAADTFGGEPSSVPAYQERRDGAGNVYFLPHPLIAS